MWDLGNTLSFFKTHFSWSNIIRDLPATEPPRRGAQRMAATAELEPATGNATLGPEEAESMVGPGTEFPGPVVLGALADRLGASGPPERQASLGVTRAGLEQGPPEHIADLQRDSGEQPEGREPLTERDLGAGLLAELPAEDLPTGPSERRRVGRSSKQLAGVPEGGPEAGALRGRGQWLQVLGGDFSHLDVSLCVVLYSLSFMGLLAMYTYFRARMRALKGHAGHPTA